MRAALSIAALVALGVGMAALWLIQLGAAM